MSYKNHCNSFLHYCKTATNPFTKESSNHIHSQTVSVRDLNLLDNIHPPSPNHLPKINKYIYQLTVLLKGKFTNLFISQECPFQTFQGEFCRGPGLAPGGPYTNLLSIIIIISYNWSWSWQQETSRNHIGFPQTSSKHICSFCSACLSQYKQKLYF